MAETAKLKLPKIGGNMTADVPRDMNALAEAVDAKAGVAGGLATLGADGKVLNADGTPAGEVTAEEFATHKAEDASLTTRGHVQLSNATNSTSDSLAATPSAVKAAMDKADAAFTSASNGKQTVGNAITGVDPNVTIPTDPTFNDLATAIGQISTGKKWASGTKVSDGTAIGFIRRNGTVSTSKHAPLVVTELEFTPSFVLIIDKGTGNYNAWTICYGGSIDSEISILDNRAYSVDGGQGEQVRKLDGTYAYLNLGFSLPAPLGVSRENLWIAFE